MPAQYEMRYKDIVSTMTLPVQNKTHRNERLGMTLLEIILALGVLAGSLAIIANLSRLSSESAISARDTTQAQFLCESIMSQLMSGVIEFEAVYDEPVYDFVDTGATNPNDTYSYKWVHSIEINTIDDYGLLEVIVIVTQYQPNSTREPVSCRLVRWMLDKAMAKEMLESEESESGSTSEDTTTETSTGNTGGNTQNSGGGNTGGGSTSGGNTGGGGGNTGGGNTGGGGQGGGGNTGGGGGNTGGGGGNTGGGNTGGGNQGQGRP